MKHRWRLLALVTLLGGLLLAGGARAERQNSVDPASLGSAASQLDETLRQQISRSGGDPEHQNLHLVIAFSTGHFAQDPLAAEAARGIASELVQHLLIRKDRLSVYAWEMGLWQHPQIRENPLVLEDDSPSAKRALRGHWPLTPQANSTGGHDTERAIAQITSELGQSADAIILLITNNAASIGAPGRRVIGQNDPSYLASLTNWRRLPPVEKSGASQILPYAIVLRDGSRRPRKLDVVIVIPRAFSGPAIVSGTRSQRLHLPEQSSHSTRRHAGDFPYLLLGLLILFPAVLVLALLLPRGMLKKHSGLSLEVAGQRFDLSGRGDGEQLCRIAGPGFPSPDRYTITVASDPPVPPICVAVFAKDRGGVRVAGEGLTLHSVDDLIQAGPCVLRPDGKHRLIFRGQHISDPFLPPRQVQVEVLAELARV